MLKQKVIQGLQWTTTSSVINALLAIIKISILARLLNKHDFGLMALAMVVLGFTNLFMNMGFSVAILHKLKISKTEYASLYWLNLSFSIFLYLLILILTPLISDFYAERILLKLLPVIGISVIFSALGFQFKVIEQKELNFKYISLVNIFANCLSFILVILLAIFNYGVWSLIISEVFKYALTNILFFINGYRKRGLLFHFSYMEAKPFIKIGIYYVGGQVINYFNRDLDILIVGKIYGASVLGGYSLAKQLVFKPTQIINPILTQVASPVLPRFQNDLKKLKTNYLRLIKAVSSINGVIYLFVFLFASIIVEVLYGAEYSDIVILVKILSLFMFLRSIGNPMGSLIIATGKTNLSFYWNLAILFIMSPALFIGSSYGVIGIAWALFFVMLFLLFPGWYFIIYKLTSANLNEYLKNIIPDINLIIKYTRKILKKSTNFENDI